MIEAQIIDLLSEKISGEWGEESISDQDVNVIRTANFTNTGEIRFDNIVKRSIDEKIVIRKKLNDGDIIIEKSGGSPNQPVGRVVYFEAPDKETYLCNNFTTVLRPNKELIHPRYLFYLLYYNYQIGKVLSFQNKTTGIINLKLDRYLNSSISYDPNLDTQSNIVAILDKASNLVKKREETIVKYDELLKGTYLEMFGDPKERSSRWNIDSIGANLQNIIAGTSYGGEEKDSLNVDELGVLKISAVTKGIFNPKEFKAVKKEILKKEPVFAKEGDLLFSRANTLELVGATCIVDKDYNHLFLPDKIWKVVTDESKLKRVYLHFVLQSKSIRESFINIATGSSGSMLNISMDKFKSIQIPIAPIELQEKFEAFYYKCRASIEKLNNSQRLMELLQKALSQQSFIGKSQFDIDLEIEAFLSSFSLDDKQFKNKRAVVNAFNNITRDQTYFQRILDKLDEQEYTEVSLYNKAKGIVFRALNKNINQIQQVFVERDNSKRIKLTVNEIIET